MYITEPEREIPVIGEYDVAVCGGGVAGVAAALAAARHGAKVLLIEKQFALGGLATLGLVTVYLPLCDGLGKQVSFGIAEELLRVSIGHGWEDKYPSAWLHGGSLEEKKQRRYEVQYNASAAAILWEKLLLKHGVELLYGTSVCAVQTENDRITALMIENKSGRQAVKVKAVADCTGDADICALSGTPTALYEQKNVLAAWYYELKNGDLKLRPLGYCDTPNKYKTAEQIGKDTRKRYQSIDGREISEQVIDMHDWQLRAFLKDGDFSLQHNMTSIGTIPQVRMTRRLCGEYTMDDVEMHKAFPDSVGLFSDWRKAGPVYALPFGTLYNRKMKNLAAAGRCISVTDDMWDITRVIPVCAVSGQAAGTALAMCPDLTSLDIAALQEALKTDSVKLHETDL